MYFLDGYCILLFISATVRRREISRSYNVYLKPYFYFFFISNGLLTNHVNVSTKSHLKKYCVYRFHGVVKQYDARAGKFRFKKGPNKRTELTDFLEFILFYKTIFSKSPRMKNKFKTLRQARHKK